MKVTEVKSDYVLGVGKTFECNGNEWMLCSRGDTVFLVCTRGGCIGTTYAQHETVVSDVDNVTESEFLELTWGNGARVFTPMFDAPPSNTVITLESDAELLELTGRTNVPIHNTTKSFVYLGTKSSHSLSSKMWTMLDSECKRRGLIE